MRIFKPDDSLLLADQFSVTDIITFHSLIK
jgi:hypothetical protein